MYQFNFWLQPEQRSKIKQLNDLSWRWLMSSWADFQFSLSRKQRKCFKTSQNKPLDYKVNKRIVFFFLPELPKSVLYWYSNNNNRICYQFHYWYKIKLKHVFLSNKDSLNKSCFTRTHFCFKRQVKNRSTRNSLTVLGEICSFYGTTVKNTYILQCSIRPHFQPVQS